MRRGALVLVAVLMVSLTGCSLRTAGAPKGELTLTATFTDVQGLVVGHSVQMADVKIGSITEVELDPRAYKGTVTMSIVDGHRIPQGTHAEIKVTSLLGENYVDLILPPGGSMDQGPFIHSGGAIPDTSVQPSFEQVVGELGPLLDAMAGGDIAKIVDAGATALDGNGERLNGMVAKSGRLLKAFADQRAQLARTVDRFARLGRSLAERKQELGRLPAELERTTAVMNKNKHEMLTTIDRLGRVAYELNDKVLEGRVLRMRKLLRDLDPVMAELGSSRAELTALVTKMVEFERKFPQATYDGQALAHNYLRPMKRGGAPILPDDPGDVPPPAELPDGVRDALPDLDAILGRP